MLKVERISVMNFDNAIRGARNPMNSWEKSDSYYDENGKFVMGPVDLDFGHRLAIAGIDHRKFLRMIFVSMDITAPLYWWKEFDTYKVGTVANSCSTMHKIHAKEFTIDDFSHEHLYGYADLFDGKEKEFVPNLKLQVDENIRYTPHGLMQLVVDMLNVCREQYLDVTKKFKKDMDKDTFKKLKRIQKKLWWQMIQLLPSSYNQRRTVMFSYEMLANTDIWRSDHKQDEWREFCKWARTLPYSELFTKQRSYEIIADNVVVTKVNIDTPPVRTDEYMDSEGNHSVTKHYEVPEADHGQKD